MAVLGLYDAALHRDEGAGAHADEQGVRLERQPVTAREGGGGATTVLELDSRQVDDRVVAHLVGVITR